MLRDTLHTVRRVPMVVGEIGYLPEAADTYFHDLAPDVTLLPQRGVDLSERLDDGAWCEHDVCCGHSDSPTLPHTYVVVRGCVTTAARAATRLWVG